jgi:ATP-binding cassette, subfamily B, bacterial
VRMADRIVVLDGGRIAESGTHDDLMGSDTVYRRMFETQMATLDIERPTTAEEQP